MINDVAKNSEFWFHFWLDPWVKLYLQNRYGASWLYYWCLWEHERELWV